MLGSDYNQLIEEERQNKLKNYTSTSYQKSPLLNHNPTHTTFNYIYIHEYIYALLL